MIDLETMLTLGSMTCIVDIYAWKLHPPDEKSSTTLLVNVMVLHYTYDGGSLYFKIEIQIEIKMYVSLC